MTEEQAKNIDPAFAEAELRRLQSEAERNHSERLKLELEAEEVRKHLNQKWYSGRFFVEAIVGGLVAAALLTAWTIEVF